MAKEEPNSASVVVEGTSEVPGETDNGSASSLQKEVEEKVDGLTLDEPTTEAAKKKKKKNKSK